MQNELTPIKKFLANWMKKPIGLLAMVDLETRVSSSLKTGALTISTDAAQLVVEPVINAAPFLLASNILMADLPWKAS